VLATPSSRCRFIKLTRAPSRQRDITMAGSSTPLTAMRTKASRQTLSSRPTVLRLSVPAGTENSPRGGPMTAGQQRIPATAAHLGLGQSPELLPNKCHGSLRDQIGAGGSSAREQTSP
jgi:hypothetical protein